MRGATEAQETLGAQQLKSQYGSVRVREKSAELQRVAADAVKIAAEIIAENFSKETVLDMSQMDVPTKADITRRIKEIEKAAKEELEGLKARAQEAMQNRSEEHTSELQSLMRIAYAVFCLKKKKHKTKKKSKDGTKKG